MLPGCGFNRVSLAADHPVVGPGRALHLDIVQRRIKQYVVGPGPAVPAAEVPLIVVIVLSLEAQLLPQSSGGPALVRAGVEIVSLAQESRKTFGPATRACVAQT